MSGKVGMHWSKGWHALVYRFKNALDVQTFTLCAMPQRLLLN